MASPQDIKPNIGIVGPGALGSALGTRLFQVGYPIGVVASRDAESAVHIAERVNALPVALENIASAASFDLLFVCVPDDAIPSVAGRLAATKPDWRNTVVAHTSGACEADLLQPLGHQGASLMSFHPLQTFTGLDDADLFDGIYVALEGDATSLELGRKVALDLGCNSIQLDRETKALYHLAASTASNSLNVIVAMAQELLNPAGIDSQTAIRMLQPLVERTWSNIQRYQPESALTGPVVRGDVSTVERHVAAISHYAPHLAPAYAALVTEAVRLAVRSGRLHIEAADAILDRIHALLTDDID